MPIIFLTAKSLKIDKLKGFNLGADDYMVKPVDEEELIARINAVMRRVRPESGDPENQPYWKFPLPPRRRNDLYYIASSSG